MTRRAIAALAALALAFGSTSATAQTRVVPHPLPRPTPLEQPPAQAAPESMPATTAGLRATFGAERAARLLRSSAADDVVRGVERLATLSTPDALSLLLRAAGASPVGTGDGVTGSARRDPRALLAVVRALARWVDREPARKALRDVLDAPLQQLDAGGPAPSGGEGADPQLHALQVLLAREQAAMALAASGSTPALEMLVEVARKGGPGEAPALAALAAHPPESPAVLGGVTLTTRSTIGLAAELGDLRALDAILGAVKASDAGLRAAAIAALGETGDARVLESARAAVHDTDAKVRVAGAAALVRLGARDASGAVEALVSDDATALDGLRLAADVQSDGVVRAAAARAAASGDPAVRAAALTALGRQASDAAVSALVQLGRDPRIQGDAVGALARSPSAAALPTLEGMGASPADARLAARAYLVRRMVRSERSAALDGLLRRLAGSPDGNDRAVGVEALVALGERPPGRALADPDPRVRRAAAMAARALPADVASPALLSRLAVETDPPTRTVLAVGLVTGDDRAALATSTLLERARAGGADAPLAALAYARRAEGATDADLGALLGSSDRLIRAHAARGLGASAASDAAGRLARAYEFEADASVRRAIVAALAGRAQDAASPARSAVLDLAARLDPDATARLTAKRALAGAPAFVDKRASVSQVAWLSLVPAQGATLPVDASATLVDAEGLALPVAFDADGFALVPGVPQGEGQLRLAPSLPSYRAPLQ